MKVRDSMPRIHLKMQDAKTIEGGYYKPEVDKEGVLRWTPSKEHMPELPESNIKGEPGKDGTDANVTTENITRALGYTPADEGDVNQLKDDLAELENAFDYFPKKQIVLNLEKGSQNTEKVVISNITLRKNVSYELISSIPSALSNNVYIYLKDGNGNNIAYGHIASSNVSARTTYTPSEDIHNASVYIIANVNSELTIIFRQIGIDGISKLVASLENAKMNIFTDIKHLMPWSINDINDNGDLGGYKFRLSSSKILSYPFDIKVNVDSDHRYGWVSYENGEKKSWNGWKTEPDIIGKGTTFRLQLARRTNESATPIYDEKENDIYKGTVIEPIENSELFTLNDSLKVKKVANSLWTQGACIVSDKIVGFYSSNEDHSTTGKITITNASDFTSYGSSTHNLGHCNSADYDGDLDIMATICSETLYVVKNFESKVTNKSNLVYGDSDIIEIPLDGLNGNMAGVCFGETNHILYIASLEDASNFDTKGKRWIYKVILGFGSNNMFEQFSSDNLGTFISGCADDEFNGTMHIIDTFVGVFFGEVQGLRYLNGNIIFSTDLYVNRTLTPFIAIAQLKDDGSFELVKAKNVPYFNANGVRSRTEAEDIVFYGDYGYMCVVDHSTWSYDIMRFEKQGIFN